MSRTLLPLVLLLGCGDSPNVEPVPDEPEQPHLALIIEDPEPAAWLDEGPVGVTGTYETLSDLRLNDGPLTATETTFGGEVDLVHGTNFIEVTGVSPGGTTYATHVSVIAGETADPDTPVAGGTALRINQGGLDFATDLAGEQLTTDTLAPLLVSDEPLYSLDEDGTRVDVTLTGFSLGATDIQVDPSDGTAALTVVLRDLSLDVNVEGASGAFFYETDQSASVRRATLTGQLGATIVDGRIATTLTDVDVVLEDFALDTSSWPSWLEGELTDIILTEVVEGGLRTALVDFVPPVIDEQLNSLELSFETVLLERTVTLAATPTAVAFDPDGLALDTDVEVQIAGGGTVDAPGTLVANAGPATLGTEADLSVGLADDLLNAAVFHAWRAGLLQYTLSTEDGTLPAYVLDVLGGARIGRLAISADLPPTLVERNGGLRAQVGELRLRLDTIDGERGEYLLMAAGGHIDLDLAVNAGVLDVGFGETEIAITVRETDWEGSLIEVTEEVEGLLPIQVALGLLEDLSIPLPTFAGVGVDTATVGRSQQAHTVVDVDLGAGAE